MDSPIESIEARPVEVVARLGGDQVDVQPIGPRGWLAHNTTDLMCSSGRQDQALPLGCLFPAAMVRHNGVFRSKCIIYLGAISGSDSVPFAAIRGEEAWSKDECEGEVLAFLASRGDGKRFCSSFDRYRAAVMMSVPPISFVKRLCKLRGQASIEVILSEWADSWHQPVEQGLSPYSEAGSAAYVRGVIEELILKDDIQGVFDADLQSYVSREFVVRTTRSVNINVELDFNAVLHQLGSKGVSLTSIRCPHCGGACELPNGGLDQFQCEYCHSIVRVTDVFAQFRDLLG